MIDLLGIQRDELNTQFINFFRTELLSLIPKLSQTQLDNLLEASFPYTYIKELQPIIFSVITQNKNIPADYLISMSTPAVYDMCPIDVRRKIWTANPQSLYDELDPLIATYFAEYVRSLSSTMIINKPQLEDESVRSVPPYTLYQFDWLTRYTRDPATRPPVIQKINDLVGNSPEVYSLILEHLESRFLDSEDDNDDDGGIHDPRYCALRCDLAVVVQESKIISINRTDVDPCYPIVNILENAVIDGKTKPEFLRTLDNFITKSVQMLGEKALPTLTMIFSNPHYANVLFYNLVELIQSIYRNKKIAARLAASSSSSSTTTTSSSLPGSALNSSPNKGINKSSINNSNSPNQKLKQAAMPSSSSITSPVTSSAKPKGGKNFRESTKIKVAKHEAMVAAKQEAALNSSNSSNNSSPIKSVEELESEEAAKIDPQNAAALLTLLRALDFAAGKRRRAEEDLNVLNALRLIHAVVDEESGTKVDWLFLEKSVLCRRIFLCHVSMTVFCSSEVPEVLDELVNLSDSALVVEPAFSRSMITALIKKRKSTDKSKPLGFRMNVFNSLLPRRNVLVVRSQLFRYLSLMIPNGKLPSIVPLLRKVIAPISEDVEMDGGEQKSLYDELVLAAGWKHFVKALTSKVENDKSVEAPQELMDLVKAVVNGDVLSHETAEALNIPAESYAPSSPCPPDIEDW